jgi:hypothetical protein
MCASLFKKDDPKGATQKTDERGVYQWQWP